MKNSRRIDLSVQQPSFSSIRQDPAWAPRPLPRPRVEVRDLTPDVQAQIDRFATAFVDDGIVREGVAGSNPVSCSIFTSVHYFRRLPGHVRTVELERAFVGISA